MKTWVCVQSIKCMKYNIEYNAKYEIWKPGSGVYKGHWPLQTDCDRWWAWWVETWVWLASKLINYFQMLNISSALPIQLRLREKEKSSEDPSMSRRCHCDKVRRAALRQSLWTFGGTDWFSCKSCDSLVWQGGAVETKPNGEYLWPFWGQDWTTGKKGWAEAETTFD